MSSRQTKKAALAALRQRRSGLAATSSKLEEYEVADEGDVYDVVDEAEYEELVEKRRQREDFVVDDGECVRGVALHCVAWRAFCAVWVLPAFFGRGTLSCACLECVGYVCTCAGAFHLALV